VALLQAQLRPQIGEDHATLHATSDWRGQRRMISLTQEKATCTIQTDCQQHGKVHRSRLAPYRQQKALHHLLLPAQPIQILPATDFHELNLEMQRMISKY